MRKKLIKNRRSVKVYVDHLKYLAVKSIATSADKSFTIWLDEKMDQDIRKNSE